MAHTERISDATLTQFLRTRDVSRVLAERHTRLSYAERKMLRAARKVSPRLPKPVQPAPDLTTRQMEIAFAALAARKGNTSAAIAAEMSNH